MEVGGKGGGRIHILAVPFLDVEGRINPILQFSKRLGMKGVKVSVLKVVVNEGGGEMNSNNNNNNNDNVIYESYGEVMVKVEERPGVAYKGREAESMESQMHRVQTSICFHLTNFITHHQTSESPVGCVVYDSLAPWVLDVATAFGLPGAAFFTESCAVNALFYHINRGSFKIPTAVGADDLLRLPHLPGLPLLLHTSDLPSLITNPQQNPSFLRLMIHQFYNNPHWIFINSFNALESQVIEWMQRYMPLKTVGPTVPSILIDQELKDDHHYGVNVTEEEDNKIMEWLDSKDCNSVIYVSFGSVSTVGEEQMEELAWGLKAANAPFLWVIKEPVEIPSKFPRNFFEEMKEMGMGMVVKWCSQVKVLAHKSVGCFVTHCGWNSVLEALTSGVPMVAMPQWKDQMTNAKFVEDVWGVGVRVSPNRNGIVGREEIQLCIMKVMAMEGEKSLEMRRNASRWMKLAKEAVTQNGTSDKNIADFVAQLSQMLIKI